MKTYLISSKSESDRQLNIKDIFANKYLNIEVIDAIYPSKIHIPFLAKLIAKSKINAGKELLLGEVGCLLSHRSIWRKIKKNSNFNDHCLILESDSCILNSALLEKNFFNLVSSYDIFFWGSWEGHTKLFRSTKKNLKDNYKTGTAFIKTVYCTYGYSLNPKAASLLLERTGKISYPVDQFKRFFKQSELKIGAILPEVISGNEMGSTIRGNNNRLFNSILFMILDIKNNIICYFK